MLTIGDVECDMVASLKGDRPANARLYRILHWLEVARRAGGKGNRLGQAEIELARRWNRDGLLSAAGLASVEAAAR